MGMMRGMSRSQRLENEMDLSSNSHNIRSLSPYLQLTTRTMLQGGDEFGPAGRRRASSRPSRVSLLDVHHLLCAVSVLGCGYCRACLTGA